MITDIKFREISIWISDFSFDEKRNPDQVQNDTVNIYGNLRDNRKAKKSKVYQTFKLKISQLNNDTKLV
jgi:hypothetical protein